MSFWDQDEIEEWFRRITGMPLRPRERYGSKNLFKEMDSIREETERMFSEQFKDIESRIPKNLIKEYETPEGEKVREFGPVVYGYSMTVGPDGKPKVREFGNIRRQGFSGFKGWFPELSSEIEPLVDLTESEKEVKVVVELPGVEKNEIKINAFPDKVDITAINPSNNKSYKKTVELPGDINIKTAKSTFKNGILEIIFEKEKDTKNGKEININ